MEDPVGAEVVSELTTELVLYTLLVVAELVAEVREVDSGGGGAVG